MLGIAPEHDAFQRRQLVLQGEVAMTGRILLEIGNLPPYQHVLQGQLPSDKVLDIPVYLTDAVYCHHYPP